MEQEYVTKLGKLYKQAKAASDERLLGVIDNAMSDLMVAEAAITKMMVAESLALEALGPDAK